MLVNQRARSGGSDRKFLKMVELLGLQNLKMVLLLGPKFSKKKYFVKILAVSSALRPILNFRSLIYIVFHYKWQQFSNFRLFRRNLEYWPTSRNFFEIFEISKFSRSLNFWLRRNLTPFLEFSGPFLSDSHAKNPKNQFLLHFYHKSFPKISQKW